MTGAGAAARAPALPRAFFARDARVVARALVGATLVHELAPGDVRVARVVETEAYRGPSDPACHARWARRGPRRSSRRRDTPTCSSSTACTSASTSPARGRGGAHGAASAVEPLAVLGAGPRRRAPGGSRERSTSDARTTASISAVAGACF